MIWYGVKWNGVVFKILTFSVFVGAVFFVTYFLVVFFIFNLLFLLALDEILADMEGGVVGSDGKLRMFRLLQGDVGSGKTAVAFLGMLKAAEQGSQSCLLAPTEVLTAQHLLVRARG